MRIILTTFCLFIFCAQMLAQWPGQKKYYKDQLEPNSKLVSTEANSTYEKTTDGSLIFKKYYVETKQLTHFYTLKIVNKKKIKHGEYREYWDDGTLVKKGNYVEDVMSGEWIFGTGGKEGITKGNYVNGNKEGEWIELDSVQVMCSKAFYKNGELNGVAYDYNADGEVKKEKYFEEGELIKEIVFGKDSTYTHQPRLDSILEIMPAFYSQACDSLINRADAYKACNQNAMLRFIYKNIRYPRYARELSIEGQAIVRFVIGKDGTVQDIKVLRGVCDAIKAECLRVVNQMPPWTPGMQAGKAVKVYFNLPISFKLT